MRVTEFHNQNLPVLGKIVETTLLSASPGQT